MCQVLNSNPSMTIDASLFPISDGSEAFFNLLIGSWFNSHESSHIVTDDGMGDCGLQNILDPQSTYRCLASGQVDFGGQIVTTTEGVFTNVSIFSDATIRYSLSASYKKITCNTGFDGGRLNFRFTNGLNNSNSTTVPNPSNIFNIGFVDVDNINLQDRVFDNLSPTMDFSQIWVTSSTDQFLSIAEIVDVRLTCRTLALNGITKTRINTNLYNFTADASKQFASYTWSVDGNDVSTNPILNFTFNEDGVYKICLDVVDEYGCCAQECDLVAIDSHCDIPDDAIIIYDCYDGVFDGVVNLADVITPIAFAPIISNRIFYIAPYTELNVTSWFTQFNGCTFQCDEGSMIRSSSPFFSIVNSTLHGCEKMWKGIYDNDATFDNFIGNRISDAEFGVNVINGLNVFISGNFFWDDYIGINFPDSEISSTRGNNIFGNEFRGVNGLLPAYQNQANHSQTMRHGIKARSLNLLLTSRNVFSNIHNGINTSFSDISSNINEFINLIGENSEDLGVAIHFKRPISNIEIRNSTINNVSSGIKGTYLFGSDIIITGNNIQNSHYKHGAAINLTDSRNCDVQINFNSVSDCENFIYMNSFHDGSYEINDNDINDSYEATHLRSILYFYQVFPGFGKNFDIKRNMINTSSVGSQEINGIYMGGNNANITENSILGINNWRSYGINITNSTNCKCTNNVIENIGNGIVGNGSSNSEYSCNLTRNCNTGFSFHNSNNMTDFKTNRLIESNNYNLHLKNATISDQLYKGNIFIGDEDEAFLDNSPINGNEFLYNATNPIPAPFNNAPYVSSDWVPEVLYIGNNTGNWFKNNPIGGTNLLCTGGPRNLEGFPIQQFEAIANGESYGTEYFDQNLWTSQWQLISIIDQYPELLNNTILDEFYHTTSDVRQYYDAAQAIKNINKVTSHDDIKLTNSEAVYSNKMAELETLINSINKDNYNDFKQNIENINNEVTLIKNEILEIITKMLTDVQSAATTLKPVIVSLPEPYAFCNDFKTVFNAKIDLTIYNEAYVKENYGDEIKKIAESCEFEIGIPYYESRGLCQLLGIDFIDNPCVELRGKDAIALNVNEIKVHPNPSSTIITLDTDKELKSIEIYGVDGSLIPISDYIVTGINVINISNLKEGIYIIKAYGNSDNDYYGKFIKI